MTTVPSGSAPRNDSANTPQQIPSRPTVPPSKPAASTGPGGPSISIPKAGKGGK